MPSTRRWSVTTHSTRASHERRRAVSLAITGPAANSATPLVSVGAVRVSRSANNVTWTEGPFSPPAAAHTSTRPSGGRIWVEHPALRVLRNSVRSGPDRRLDEMQLGPRQIHVHVAPDPIQGVLDRQPPLPKRIESIIGGRWPAPTGGPIQGGIRKTDTFGDQSLLSGRGGQLRDRIHLIQTHFPGSETLPEQGQISKTSGDPDQLPSGRMTEIEPGRDPLGQIPSPIDQELLGDIGLDQPVANLSVEHGEAGEQLRQHLLDLIVGEALPLHVINVGRRWDRNGPETGD